MEPAAYGMEGLATLPVFFKLKGRFVALAGGDQAAAWKAELLAAAGAAVRVHAAEPGAEMVALAKRNPEIALVGREWAAGDLTGAALAIGAIEDEAEADAFARAARAAGVPVNVIDKPAFCDFQFGTIVARSPLVIGISTDGAAPVLGQAIRTRIEALLPQALRSWAEAARDWRPAVQARQLGFRTRRRFWETFARRAMSADGPPTPADRAACFAALEQEEDEVPGRIWLVGSGPGTPGALTLDGLAALQAAEVVIYDRDVGDATIGLARRESLKSRADQEEESRREASDLARRGKQVAWLGTGSPAVCARWDERRLSLAGSSIPVTVVPGLGTCPICPDFCRHRPG